MPHIFVDADACPVKREVYRVAERHGLGVTVVANARIHVPATPEIRLEIVGAGLDAADDWIAEHVGDGDIVVSADIPLAARCVKQGALVVSPAGKLLTDRNTGDVLATRNLLSELRGAGEITGGPPPFDARDRSRFLQALDQAINAVGKRR
jgi:uncharacterized protein